MKFFLRILIVTMLDNTYYKVHSYSRLPNLVGNAFVKIVVILFIGGLKL